MFKNFKSLFALPVVALSLASCNNAPKTIAYNQMREFAVRTYDERALDAIPANYTLNLNTMQANVLVDYETPTGGSDSFTISFGFNGIHILVRDQYAICLSSSLIDTIERYYSDFVGIAITLKEESPIALYYQLIGGNRSKVDITTSEKLVGSTLVKFLQMGAGMLDLLASATGYIPVEAAEDIGILTNPTTKMIIGYLSQMLAKIMPNFDQEKAFSVLFPILDYIGIVISNSSESHGEVFDTYVTTDDFGFINKVDFNFKSSFNISGLASYKRYEDINPKEGDQPIGTEASYRFTLTGSVDFDFDISTEIIR